jgi:hypothetical protein
LVFERVLKVHFISLLLSDKVAAPSLSNNLKYDQYTE